MCNSADEAKEWKNRVLQAAYGGDPNIKDLEPPKKRVLALLNPFGGMGLAPRKWQTAKEILDLAHIDITLKETERAKHAFDILKNELQPGDYDGIITVSGDGLIHESINGAMSRPDFQEFVAQTVFGFIPAGTANGLHKSVVSQFQESEGIHTAAFAVAKGRTTKMDLTELDLEYQPEQKVYMFLMMSWAIISDSDINSEVIRWIGSPRFTIWGVYRIISLRHYPGELSYTGVTQIQRQQDAKVEEIQEIRHPQESFKFLSIYNCPWIGSTFNAAPLSKIDDGTNDIMLMDS